MLDRAQVSDDPGVDLGLAATGRAGRLLAGEVPVLRADGEAGTQGVIGKVERLCDPSHQALGGLRARVAFPEEGVEDRATGVAGLQWILEAEGLPRHALVCERHVGVGISKDDVLRRSLPIPAKDYLPVSLEEKIICVADKYFSKNPRKLWKREKDAKIEESLKRYGPDMLKRWRQIRKEILGD